MANCDVVYLPNDCELAHFTVASMAAVYVTLRIDNATGCFRFDSSYYKELTALYKDDDAFFAQMDEVLQGYLDGTNNAYHFRGQGTLRVSPWLLEALYADRGYEPNRACAKGAVERLNVERWAAIERVRRANVAQAVYIWELYAKDFGVEVGRSPRQ